MMDNSGVAVRTSELVRTYRRRKKDEEVVALDGVDIEIPNGEVHGLLGPNGAGKTTLCKILSTVLLPSSGNAWVNGYEVTANTGDVRQQVGIVFGGERGLYNRLTAEANLEFWATLYGLRKRAMRVRVTDLLERFGLIDRRNDRVETFSRGMKQRLHLARGLVGDPSVLLLDEPTVGMDPVAARQFRDMVLELKGEGRSILVTTHDMGEAEAICDRVSLIDTGRVIITESPATLGRWLKQYVSIVASNIPPSTMHGLRNSISALNGVTEVKTLDPGRIKVEIDANEAALEVIQMLTEAGIYQVTSGPPSLTDVYIQLIGNRGMNVGG